MKCRFKFYVAALSLNTLNLSAVELSEISVQASMSEISRELQSNSISLISAQNLNRDAHSADIQSLLSRVPGIEYSRSGGINGQISMRGMNSNYGRNIFTIDGVRYTGRSTLELNLIDPNSLEDIEIIRGGGSGIYGSNGMNGVVNFKTRRWHGDINAPFDMKFRVRNAGFASVNNMFNSRFEAIGGGNGWDILIGLNERKGGDFKTPLGKAQNSKFTHIGTDFNIGYTSGDTRFYTQGRFNHAITHRAGGQGTSGGSSAGVFMREDPLVEYYLRAGAQTSTSFAQKIDSYLYYREFDTDIYNDRTRTKSKIDIHQLVKNSKMFGGATNFISTIGSCELSYGADFLAQIWHNPAIVQNRTAHKTTTPARPFDSTDIGIYLKNNYLASEKLSLNAGIRYDHIIQRIGKKRGTGELANTSKALDSAGQKTQNALTGSIGAVYFWSDNFSTTLNLSHNFKAASPMQMMQSTPSGNALIKVVPNTDLGNETSQTYELSLRYNDGENFTTLTGFYTRYKDMIALVNLNATQKQNQNIGKAYIGGFELEGAHKFGENGEFGLNYAATYLKSKDKTHSRPIAYIAPFSAKFGINYDTQYALFGLNERIFAQKNKIDKTNERKRAGFAVSEIYADLKLGQILNDAKNMYLTLGVDNIFNQKGVNPTTFEDVNSPQTLTNPLIEPGRNFYAKFRYEY